jgi:outer membrane protein OmpA-like peptidoglycan-associated protein
LFEEAMDDSGSPRDAFSRRKTPAGNGLGGAPDKFRKPAAKSGGDAFKSAGKAGQLASHGDAFAPKPKRPKALPAPALFKSPQKPKAGLTPAAPPAAATFGQPKPAPLKTPKLTPAAPTPPKMTMAKGAPVKAAPRNPLQPAQGRPEKPAVAFPVNRLQEKPAKLVPDAATASINTKSTDAFGRKDARPERPKALVPAPSTPPVSPMTRPAPQPERSFALRSGAIPPPVRPAPVRPATPAAVPPPTIETPSVVDEPKAEAARSPLQIVQTESAIERIGLKKFRRAAQTSSRVLMTGGGAEVVTSVDTSDGPPETEDGSISMAASGDPDSLVADKKPPDPPASPASPPVTEKPSAPQAPPASSVTSEPVPPPQPPADKPAEAAVAPPPEAASAEVAPDPVVAAAAAGVAAAASAEAAPSPPPAAEQPVEVVEVVEATVEPPPSQPFDTASEPVEDTRRPSRRRPVEQGPGAVETSWQPVESAPAEEGQPAVAVLRKMETSPVGGFWGGAAAGAQAATRKRGFNQDDMFGVMFGLAVIAFFLLWLFRGKGAVPPSEDELLTAQSAPSTASAPAPLALVDPFGNAPVDLRPSGPIVETPPSQQPVVPPAVAATPPPAPAVTAPPVTADTGISLADTRMHVWFCTASSRITKASRTQLTGELARFEDVFAGQQLVVRGYADTRGSTELNADLGQRRAQTVATYLTKKGLSVVDVQGVGELEGLDDNQNCPNQRRVDIWVKGGPAESPSRACVPEEEASALVCG